MKNHSSDTIPEKKSARRTFLARILAAAAAGIPVVRVLKNGFRFRTAERPAPAKDVRYPVIHPDAVSRNTSSKNPA